MNTINITELALAVSRYVPAWDPRASRIICGVPVSVTCALCALFSAICLSARAPDALSFGPHAVIMRSSEPLAQRLKRRRRLKLSDRAPVFSAVNIRKRF